MDGTMDLFKALFRCGTILLKDAEERLRVSRNEIDKLIDDKLIKRDRIEENKKELIILKLTDKGEAYIKVQLPEIKGSIYRGFDSYRDLKLCKFYLDRTEEQKETWVTKDELMVKHMLSGTVDGLYINECGKSVGVRVFKQTSNMKDVERTEAFIKEAGIEESYYIQS